MHLCVCTVALRRDFTGYPHGSVATQAAHEKGYVGERHMVLHKIMSILFFPYINFCSAIIPRPREKLPKIQC